MWYFKGLQGLQIKEIRFQIFSSRSALFSLIPDSRHAVFRRFASLAFEGVCVWRAILLQEAEGRVHGSGFRITGTGKFADSMNSDSWKEKFDKNRLSRGQPRVAREIGNGVNFQPKAASRPAPHPASPRKNGERGRASD